MPSQIASEDSPEGSIQSWRTKWVSGVRSDIMDYFTGVALNSDSDIRVDTWGTDSPLNIVEYDRADTIRCLDRTRS